MSDGITEATDITDTMLSETGVARLLRKSAELGGSALLDAFYWDLETFATGDLADDVSAVLFEFFGAKANSD